MFSLKSTERHWEEIRDYLVRSYFQDDVTTPSFSTTTSEDDDDDIPPSSGAPPLRSPIKLPTISPLPELIVERVNRKSLCDETDEFYEDLEVKCKNYLKQIKDNLCDDDMAYIKLMNTSQDLTTDDDGSNLSPDNNINESNSEVYKLIDLSANGNSTNNVTEVNERDAIVEEKYLHNTPVKANSNEELHEPYIHSIKSTLNSANETNINRNDSTPERDSLTVKLNDSCEESITFTLEDTNNCKINIQREIHSNQNETNGEDESSSESHYELVTGTTTADVHNVPNIYTPNLQNTMDTSDDSAILGAEIKRNAEFNNHSDQSDSENSKYNNSSAEIVDKSVDFASDMEDNSDMGVLEPTVDESMVEENSDRVQYLLETILEEGESQLNSSSVENNEDYVERDVTTGPQSHNDSAMEVNADASNAPEIMRATNRKSFRTTRFTFPTQGTDDELDIFSVPKTAAKKHSEIQEEREEIHDVSHASPEDAAATPNRNYVTSTHKKIISERDVTTVAGPKSHDDSATEINASTSNSPEIMRATNRKSFRTTRFTFPTQGTDDELDIFSVPKTAAKKHSEIQEEREEIHDVSHTSPEDAAATPNRDYVTSTDEKRKSRNDRERTATRISRNDRERTATRKSRNDRERTATSPKLVNKSLQCDIGSATFNTRKRRADDTVNNERTSGTDEGWETLRESFFVGAPKFYRLCLIKHT